MGMLLLYYQHCIKLCSTFRDFAQIWMTGMLCFRNKMIQFMPSPITKGLCTQWHAVPPIKAWLLPEVEMTSPLISGLAMQSLTSSFKVIRIQ
ncbi:hypothetical protein M758_UG273200 [Ceratodon purpureus]|nr:hypothetical protein M758_UG273200 [Ceratodon purpureus]